MRHPIFSVSITIVLSVSLSASAYTFSSFYQPRSSPLPVPKATPSNLLSLLGPESKSSDVNPLVAGSMQKNIQLTIRRFFHKIWGIVTIKGSNVRYDDSMNLRNILWLAPLPGCASKSWVASGVFVVLDAHPADGITYRDLRPEYAQFGRTFYEG